MNEIQREFLEIIEKGDVNAKDACKSLNIEPEDNNPDGGYYVVLMRKLDWVVGDPEHPLTDCVDVHQSEDNIANKDRFFLTPKGRDCLESYRSEYKKDVVVERSNKVALATFIVTVVGVIVAIYIGFR